MSKKRRQHSPASKAKEALAAIRNEETTVEMAQRLGVHPKMISGWKKTQLEGVNDIFDNHHKTQKQTDAKIDELHRRIGQLKVENDFLAKKTAFNAKGRKQMIDPGQKKLSLSGQWKVSSGIFSTISMEHQVTPRNFLDKRSINPAKI